MIKCTRPTWVGNLVWFTLIACRAGGRYLTYWVFRTKISDFSCTVDGPVMFVRGQARFTHLGLAFRSWSRKYWWGIHVTQRITAQYFSDIIMWQDVFEITTEPYAGGLFDCAYTSSWRHAWHVGYCVYVGLRHHCRRITYTEYLEDRGVGLFRAGGVTPDCGLWRVTLVTLWFGTPCAPCHPSPFSACFFPLLSRSNESTRYWYGVRWWKRLWDKEY